METHLNASGRECVAAGVRAPSYQPRVPLVGREAQELVGREAQDLERRRVAQVLAASLARNFDLYELASVGYCGVSEKGWITEANPTLAALLGVERNTLLAAPLSRFILKEDQDDLRRLIQRALAAQGGPAATGELRLVRAEGAPLWAQLVVSLEPRMGDDVGPDGTRGADGTRSLCVVTTDISARKAAEASLALRECELAQAKKLESVGRLAGGFAHQLNNMLAVVLGNAELALRQVDASSPARGRLEEIRTAAERSAEIVQQLLAHAGKRLVAPKVIDLNATVATTIATFRSNLREDVRLIWKPEGELWPVRIDPSQVDRILGNLGANAVDAIGEGGTITIETHNRNVATCACVNRACRGSRTSPGTRGPDAYVAIVVSDDGCGMDKETLAVAFEPFFTTKGVGKGTGLGLAAVYGEVTQNHGVVSAQSVPGAGTTFTICLPRYDEADRENAGLAIASTA